MKKNFLIVFVSLILFSCNENEIIQGEIYIKLIDVHNLYGVYERQIEKINLVIDNPNQNQLTSSEKELYKLYEILLNNDLINKPYFKLKLANGELINIYTTESEFTKLKTELDNFDKYKEKIMVKFEGSRISEGVPNSEEILRQSIYSANNIIFIEKTVGKTDWKK